MKFAKKQNGYWVGLAIEGNIENGRGDWVKNQQWKRHLENFKNKQKIDV